MTLLWKRIAILVNFASLIYCAILKNDVQNYDSKNSFLSDGEDLEKSRTRIIDGAFGSCPVQNSRFPVLLPHPSDCNKFYICDNGLAHMKVCHPGLHFNPKSKTCDFPKNVGCDAAYNTPALRTTDDPGKPRGKVIEEDFNTCPTENPKFPVLLPHPSDCSKFYICNSGRAHPQKCQSGLHFNPKIKTCDFPENAGCDSENFEKPKGKVIDKDSNMCPAENSKHPVLLPHPSDCNKFYICNTGHAHPQKCQSGLHFNPKIKVCDYPEKAGCNKDVAVAMAGVPSPFCPSRDGKFPIFFRHPTNCSVFYLCANGFAYEFTCPARLHFNVRKKRCDYENNSGCKDINQ